jgi:phospholipase C
VLDLTGGKPGSAVVVRNARGKVVVHGRVHTGGRLVLKVPTARMTVGRHGLTVMYVDARGHHHTKNVKVRVTPRS